MNDEGIIDLINRDDFRMEALEAARSLKLPDWMIGAGFVRNAVWDYLHGFVDATPLNDIDLIYFDDENIQEEPEKNFEKRLGVLFDAPWSVKNQARMHIDYDREAFISTEDALAHWVETATCVAVRLRG